MGVGVGAGVGEEWGRFQGHSKHETKFQTNRNALHIDRTSNILLW